MTRATGVCESLLSRLAVPRRGLPVVLRRALPVGIQHPKVVLGVCVSRVRFDTEGCDLRRVGGDGLRRSLDGGGLLTRYAAHQQQGQHPATKSAHCQHSQSLAKTATAGAFGADAPVQIVFRLRGR